MAAAAVSDETLRELYEMLKWAPTSANAAPARFAFLRSKEAKERLRPALAPLNVEKTMTAPVTVIVAYDMKFYEQLPKLFPHSPGMAALFESNPEMVGSDREAEFQPAGGVPDHGGAGARPRLRADVRLRSTRRWTRSSSRPASPVSAAIRSSSRKDTSRRISSATSGTVIPARSTRACRVCRSTRRVHYYDLMRFRSELCMLSVRPAVDTDLPALTEIYNHYVVHTPITFDVRPFQPEERRQWFADHAGGRHR